MDTPNSSGKVDQITEKDVKEAGKRAQKVLEEKDQESKFRKTLPKFWTMLVAVISVVYVSYHLYTSGFGMPMAYKHRVIHLGFVLTLMFLLYPASKRSSRNKPTVLDILLALVSIGCCLYYYYNIDLIAMRAGRATPTDLLVAGIGCLIVLEACRRVVGLQLLGLAIVLILYARYGNLIPGTLSHQGYSVNRLVYQFMLTTQGVFGIPLHVSAQYMVLFITFASVLSQTGLGRVFQDVSMGIAGRSPGGPAKVAVISSGLMGMISGGAAANVATTGALTIPLMVKTGYKPYYAAGIEAAASTGGQIMPPIMGAVAFIMAEFTGIPYLRIAASALIPALLYFTSVYFTVDFRARKAGLVGLPKEDIPDYITSIKRYGHMVLPVLLLVYLLMRRYSPMYAGFYGLLSTMALAFLRPHTRMGPMAFLTVMRNAARSTISVAVAMATAGFVVAVLSLTGIGLILADNIVFLAGGRMFLVLFFTMIVCIILGMGLPTSACYVISATVAVGILRGVGIDPLPTHMFVLYFAVLSTVTPPVALAAYVGAGIANAPSGQVGWTAFRIAIAGFIIPYFFIYSPAMLLIADSNLLIVRAVITAIIGVYFLACSTEGYFFGTMNIPSRLLVLGAALTLINPTLYSDAVGLGLGLVAYMSARFWRKRKGSPVH